MKILTIILLIAAWSHLRADESQQANLKMALVNIRTQFSAGPNAEENRANIQSNLDRHVYFIELAANQGSEFVGFPEMSINGYRFSNTMTWLRLDGPEVSVLQRAAVERKVYLSAGIAEEEDGKRWNTHFVIDPAGKLIGKHRKIWLTGEKGFTEAGTEHNVFDVKGAKMGIAICADGSDRKNLQSLVDNGAQIIYGPHANHTGGTVAGWYNFRKNWGGPTGWIAELKVHAALHNHAGLYHPDFKAPETSSPVNTGWASGAWFIGPDGGTLARMDPSSNKADSRENVLMFNVPITTVPRTSSSRSQ